MRGPTRANTTGVATQTDTVMTPRPIARAIYEHFAPTGVVMEPARGTGSFYDLMPKGSPWAEITRGRDFFDFEGRADWIITNPPFSIYDRFLDKCFEVADNVVLLCPVQKAFKSMSNQRKVDAYGGLREVYIIGGGAKCGFNFGFLTGCLHYQRGYKGPIHRVMADIP